MPHLSSATVRLQPFCAVTANVVFSEHLAKLDRTINFFNGDLSVHPFVCLFVTIVSNRATPTRFNISTYILHHTIER